MATQKQIEANRRNAKKSTGPASVAGKATSSMNALKTGIHAKSVIIPGENAADLQRLIDEYYAYYQPATPTARGLVDDLIRTEWTLRRLDTSEASLCQYQIDQSIRPVPDAHRQGKLVSQNMKTLAAIQRRLDATRRGRDRALQQLRQHRNDPAPAAESARAPTLTLCPSAASAEIGFVPSPPAEPPSARVFTSSPEPESTREVVLS